MTADQNFYDIRFTFFILRLRLQPMAKGRSFSGPNVWLRPKVKIAPTVQHCYIGIGALYHKSTRTKSREDESIAALHPFDQGCEGGGSRCSDRKTKKRQNSRSKQRILCHVVLRRIKTCQSWFLICRENISKFYISKFVNLDTHLYGPQSFVHHLNVQLNLGFSILNDGKKYIDPTSSISGITAFCETYKL